VSGGLGWTDIGDKSVIGGAAERFFIDIGTVYGHLDVPTYHFEPHVAEDVFMAWLKKYNVSLFLGQRIKSVGVENSRILSFDTMQGMKFIGTQFIDASYEGDLMALAGVSYTWGREGREKYNESLAGVQNEPLSNNGQQFPSSISPFYANGSLLPMIYGGEIGEVGSGDEFVYF